jgi:hypothetical protein
MRSYKANLYKVAEEEHTEAVKAWLKKVLANTPTYTGTARGTYAPVGRTVGRTVRRGIVRGKTNPRRKKYFQYPKGGKKWPLGFSAGANYSDHEIKGRISGGTLKFTFMFDQQLPYVMWNEVYPAPAWMTLPSNPPWLALTKANKTFARRINNNFNKEVNKQGPIIARKSLRG